MGILIIWEGDWTTLVERLHPVREPRGLAGRRWWLRARNGVLCLSLDLGAQYWETSGDQIGWTSSSQREVLGKRNANIQVTRPLRVASSLSPSPIEAPAFPTVACLVRFGMSNTSTRFLPFLKNLLQLPTCQILWPAFHAPISCCLPASIRPFSLLQTLWASLLLCLCSLRCNGREPVNFRGGRATFKALWRCDILMKLEGLLWVIWLNESNRNDTMWLPKLDNKNIIQFPFCAFESRMGTGCPRAGVLANGHCQLPDRWVKNPPGESIPQISSHPAIIPSWGLTPWSRDELPWSTEFMW